MPSTPDWLWLAPPLAAAGLAAAVWAYLNYGGFGRSLRYRLPQPDEALPPEDHGPLPGVAILSPGRDEAEHLPTVLPALCEQDHPGYRVVFIDDASTDATPGIAAALAERYPHLLVVRNDTEPPEGWMGKCWAIHQGYDALRQSEIQNPKSEIDWLCFTDADIHWHPALLRTALRHAIEHDADLLGVAPTLRFGSASEAIVQLQLVLALGLMVPFERAMDPASPKALTGGAFILVKRKFYDDLGGHTAVRGEMVEDLKLGMALKAAGAEHRVAVAGDLQWCRMYDGWADMWEGLTKNAYAGLGRRWYAAAGLLVATLLLNVLPAPGSVAAAVWLVVDPSWPVALLAALWLAATLLQARALNAVRKLMRLPWPYAWTMPLGSAAYAAILLASAIQHHTTGNRWKGRRYPAT
ncbi:MAG: glycosyltransferase family 2 protein [Planctomycetota bacterium]